MISDLQEGAKKDAPASALGVRACNQKSEIRNQKSSAFTLVELLVVITIIGILISLLLPAVQAAREAARSLQCKNNLKQIGLALHLYHEAHAVFPPGGITKIPESTCLLSGDEQKDGGAPWSVFILPYLEQQARYDQYNFSLSFSSTYWMPGGNHNVQFRPNSKFQCPSDPASRSDHCNTNYFGSQGGGATPDCYGSWSQGRAYFHNGVFSNNSHVSVATMRDGSSNVFMVGESKYCPLIDARPDGAYCSWDSALRVYGGDGGASFPMNLCAAMYAINSADVLGYDPFQIFTGSVCSSTFGSYHRGGCNFTMADGSVHFVSENIDLTTYRALGSRNDGRPLGGFSE